MLTWDIFCRVIDNYGDIGVCLRLARQLATEYGLRVRLFVDDLDTLSRFCSESNAGIDVLPWGESFSGVQPADVVIEAFGCELPESYMDAMATRATAPVWINLEYLTAEAWAEASHLATSPHPRLPLTKYFYFPGVTIQSGGLIREKYLPCDESVVWPLLGLQPPMPDELRISLFCYPNAPLESLFTSWSCGDVKVTCCYPQGLLSPFLEARFASSGNLQLHPFKFLSQLQYDQLLAACDCNFVRGEDSFVRAQWAGKPFIWNIYPQAEGAHWPKLEAFLTQYGRGLDALASQSHHSFWRRWNRSGELDWPSFWQYRKTLQAHAEGWRTTLLAQPDLAAKLVTFCKNRI